MLRSYADWLESRLAITLALGTYVIACTPVVPQMPDATTSRCEPEDATRTIACGEDDEGLQAQRCVSGLWQNEGARELPGPCTEDETRDVACEVGEFGVRTERCVDGTWQAHEGCEPISIASAQLHNCAVARSGNVFCWGAGNEGRLGNDDTLDQPIPVRVRNLDDATQVSTSAGHSCARRANGTVACWGKSSDGQLGTGGIPASVSTPLTIDGLIDVAQIATGVAHSCARRTNGTVACWGLGDEGRRVPQLRPATRGRRALLGIDIARQARKRRRHGRASDDTGPCLDARRRRRDLRGQAQLHTAPLRSDRLLGARGQRPARSWRDTERTEHPRARLGCRRRALGERSEREHAQLRGARER